MVVREHKDVKTADGTCQCYVAAPSVNRKFPGVVLLMDAFGPRQALYDLCDRIAKQGFVVILPNVFYRNLSVPLFPQLQFPLKPDDMPAARELIIPNVRSYNHQLFIADFPSILEELRAHPKCDPEAKIGISGYCFGAGLATRVAAAFPDVVGAIGGFHGGNLATDAPDSPHTLLPNIKAFLLYGHAENDHSLPQEQIDRFKAALDSAGCRYQMEVYAGAGHGYAMTDLPMYNQEGEEKHYEQLIETLKRELTPE